MKSNGNFAEVKRMGMNTEQTLIMLDAVKANERYKTLEEVLEAAMLSSSTEEIISIIFRKMMECQK